MENKESRNDQTTSNLTRRNRDRALLLLFEGYRTAIEFGRDPKEFASQMALLLKEGINQNVLRWLVAGKYALHFLERPSSRKGIRRLVLAPGLRLFKNSCFLLTNLGQRLAEKVENEIGGQTNLAPRAVCIPQFDTKTHTLWLGRMVVKQFKVPALNQVLILSSFHEQKWMPRIDDPLPPSIEVNSKKKLKDAIWRLNNNQRFALIKFRAIDEGRGIAWEITK